jgi:alpha-galactosidase
MPTAPGFPLPIRPKNASQIAMKLATSPRTKPPSATAHFRVPLAFLLLLAFSLLAARESLGASDLDGVWRMDTHKPFGVTTHTFLVLHKEGNTLTGMVYPNSAWESRMLNPHMEGSGAVFSIDWGWTFYVHRAGANLRITLKTDGAEAIQAIAYPISVADMRPPSPLPVPAIRDLPDNGLARTPPMGWSSWNHFEEAVDDRTVRETADAMVSTGMAAAGYVYVNIDDTWEGDKRDSKGNLTTNRKFPDMKALSAYVHGKGLKLGVYTSPGFVTCGGYIASLGHEEQDMRSLAEWGVDYVKVDWCSSSRIYPDTELRQVYQKMGEALEHCGRPIVFSLCEYGMGDVWRWGASVSGNLWRTNGDIHDSWKSMADIGFEQGKLAPYAGPGHWNDPDMLEVGNGGMTDTEYRTHFSLWCMLAAPLIAGNDLRSMSDETRDILTNREVIAVDQDALGRQGSRLFAQGDIEVWSKPLSGGRQAVGIFNRGAAGTTASVTWRQIDRGSKPSGVRDLWKHRDLTVADVGVSAEVPSHGVVMLLVK